MPDIAFPTSSRPGLSAEEGAGRLINAYAEQLGAGARQAVSIRRAPGLAAAAETGRRGLRGGRMVGDTLLLAYADMLCGMGADGTVHDICPLPGEQRVTVARNNRSPVPQVVAVTEHAVLSLSKDGPPQAIPTPGNLPFPNSVEFHQGWYFFTALEGTCYASQLNDTTFNTLDRTKEQGRGSGLLRAISFRSELFLFGPQEIGVYSGSQATGFPLARQTGIPRGLIGQWAIAGHEEGWSNTLIWVGDDAVVYRLDGYSPTRISNHDVERDLAAAAKGDRAQIEASVFAAGGHSFWVVSMPGRTWVFDLVTGEWHERESHGRDRWRATLGFKAFGRWLVGDRASSKLLEVREDAFTEAGAPLRWCVESLPGEAFPSRLAIPRADFDFVVGQGRAPEGGIAADPKVLVGWSDDGGGFWASPLTRSLGRQGQTRTRVSVLRTGMTGVQGRTWRLEVTDPVYVALLGGSMAVESRTE